MGRLEEDKQAELQAILERAARDHDAEFAAELLISRKTKPMAMIEWLAKRVKGAADEPEAVHWKRVTKAYAKHHLDRGSEAQALEHIYETAAQEINDYENDPRSGS